METREKALSIRVQRLLDEGLKRPEVAEVMRSYESHRAGADRIRQAPAGALQQSIPQKA
jgi:hypothetical protein